MTSIWAEIRTKDLTNANQGLLRLIHRLKRTNALSLRAALSKPSSANFWAEPRLCLVTHVLFMKVTFSRERAVSLYAKATFLLTHYVVGLRCQRPGHLLTTCCREGRGAEDEMNLSVVCYWHNNASIFRLSAVCGRTCNTMTILSLFRFPFMKA